MFKNSVSALLIVSIFSWTLGCTSMRTVTRTRSLEEYAGKKIEVHTMDGHYVFSSWSESPSGDIIGTGTFHIKHSKDDVVEVVSERVKSERILLTRVRRFDQLETTLLVVLVVGVVVLVATAEVPVDLPAIPITLGPAY